MLCENTAAILMTFMVCKLKDLYTLIYWNHYLIQEPLKIYKYFFRLLWELPLPVRISLVKNLTPEGVMNSRYFVLKIIQLVKKKKTNIPYALKVASL